MAAHKVDEIDRRILLALQSNCRTTNAEIAKITGLSPSATLRRVRELEQSGAIIGYTAIIDPMVLGLGVAAFVHVTLDKDGETSDEAFRNAALNRSEIAGCYACAGDYDYYLKVVVPDHDTYMRFVVELRRMIGVAAVSCGIALKPQPAIFAFYRLSYSSSQAPRLITEQPPMPDTWAPRLSNLDAFDRKIIFELQMNSRIGLRDLAKRVHLSPPAILRRLRALESRGLVCGYTALVEPSAIGLGLLALVSVTLEKGSDSEGAFEAAIAERPEVAACFAVAGNVDYEMRVVTPDVETYARFIKEFLRRICGVASVQSSICISPPPHLFAHYRAINAIEKGSPAPQRRRSFS